MIGLVVLALLGADPALPTAGPLTATQVIETLWPKTADVRFARTTVTERRAMTALVAQLWRGLKPGSETAADARSTAAKIGLQLKPMTVAGHRYWALVEPSESQRGAGAYIFRVDPKDEANTVLQAPHAYYDRHTGVIAAHIFFSPPGQTARAFFTNTQHRYRAYSGKRVTRRDSPSDVCHVADHLFSTATQAARDAGATEFVQLHGFGGKNIDEPIAGVVSGGRSDRATDLALRTVANLRPVLGAGLRLYPEETKHLGATTNAQGRLVRDSDGNGFVHVELSAEVRKQLKDDPTLRAEFGRALLRAGDEPSPEVTP